MDSNLIVPESVDISQILGVDKVNLDRDTKGSSAVPQPLRSPPWVPVDSARFPVESQNEILSEEL